MGDVIEGRKEATNHDIRLRDQRMGRRHLKSEQRDALVISLFFLPSVVKEESNRQHEICIFVNVDEILSSGDSQGQCLNQYERGKTSYAMYHFEF